MSPLFGKLSKREKVLLYIMLIVILLAAMGAFLLKPAIEKNSKLTDSLYKLQDQEMTMRFSVQNLEAHRANLERIERENQDLFKVVFPVMANDAVDKFVTDFVLNYSLEPRSLVIAEAQLKYVSPYLSQKNEKSDITMVVSTVTIKLEGLKDDLVLLLDMLDSINGIKVNNCTINAGSNGTIGGTVAPVSINLSFDIYMHERGTASVNNVLMRAGANP